MSLCRCSFVCVHHSIFYICVTCCDLDVTMRRHDKSEREKARGNNNDLSYVPSERKEEIKSGTSGCGSFVVPYFQPATSTTDHLHNKHVFVTTKACLSQQNCCHDKHVFVATNICCNKSFVTTNIVLSSQKFCCDKHAFVMTNMCLS